MSTCTHAPTAVSLFDGIGGFPLALSRAGYRTVATVEIDKAAAGVSCEHFPDAVHFSDVTEVKVDDLLAAGFCPLCGLVAGGWPCQDLSLAGRRLGLGGARSGLFFEIVRLARDLRPRWLLLENVPGLLSAVCSCPGLGICGGGCTDPHPVPGGSCGVRGRGRNRRGRCMEIHGGAMGAVLGALGELGYGFAYRVLDAQHFGVPQRRRRVVIVGCLGDGAAPAAVLLEPEGGTGDPAAGRAAGEGAAGQPAVGADLARVYSDTAPTVAGGGQRGYRVDAETAAGGGLIPVGVPDLAYALTARASMDRPESKAVTLIPHVANTMTVHGAGSADPEMETLLGFDAAQITSLQNRSNPRPGDPQPPLAATGQPHIAYALRADPGGVGQGHNTNYVPVDPSTVLGSVTHALTAEGPDAGEDGTGRGTPVIAFGHRQGLDPQASDQNTPTLRANGDGAGVATPAAVRRLTPVECERLQGYPDGWTAVSAGRAQADSGRYRQLGNSIAVPVFEWVARRIAAYGAGPL